MEFKSTGFWQHPLFAGIMFSYLEKGENRCDAHFHLDFELTLVNSGVMEYRVARKKQYLVENQILLINPLEVHQAMAATEAGVSVSNIRIAPGFIPTVCEHLEVPAPPDLLFSARKMVSPELIGMFKQFHQSSKNQDPLQMLHVTEVGWHLLEHLFTSYTNLVKPMDADNLPPALQQRTTDYMREHINERITLATMAAEVNLSEYHFLRQFKKVSGLSPYQYLIRLRIEIAMQMLAKGKLCAEVATLCGFFDQAHMNKLFRDQLGFTPKKIQQFML